MSQERYQNIPGFKRLKVPDNSIAVIEGQQKATTIRRGQESELALQAHLGYLEGLHNGLTYGDYEDARDMARMYSLLDELNFNDRIVFISPDEVVNALRDFQSRERRDPSIQTPPKIIIKNKDKIVDKIPEILEDNRRLANVQRPYTESQTAKGEPAPEELARFNDETFGGVLKYLRVSGGLTLRALSARSELDATYIGRLEKGVYNPPRLRTLDKLISGLGLGPDHPYAQLLNVKVRLARR